MTTSANDHTTAISRRGFLGAVGATAATAAVPGAAATAAGATTDANTAATAGGGEPISWWSTTGTHYRADAVDQWLGMIRGYPGPHANVGFTPEVTDVDHEGIEPTIGRFSGKERFYDWTGQVTGFDHVSAVRNAVELGVDLVWVTGQAAVGSGNDASEHAADILINDPERFMDCLHAMATFFNTGEFADLPITIYWEIGNEVNASPRFSITPGRPNHDPQNAADYAEYYLRPATVAIQTASQEIYGDKHQVRMMGPNVSGIQKEPARAFLQTALEHRYGSAQGHLAGLSGRKVFQTIELFSIHYSSGECPVHEELYERYIASGKLRGWLNTEELGTRGRGDFNTVLVGVRNIDFWIQHNWHRDTGRVMFWGDGPAAQARRRNSWGVDQSGKAGEELLGTFLRDDPLTRSKHDGVEVISGADVEWYALRADGGDSSHRQLVYVKPIHSAINLLSAVEFADETPDTLTAVDVFLVHAKDPISPFDDYTVEATEDGALSIVFAHELDLNESFVIRTTFGS